MDNMHITPPKPHEYAEIVSFFYTRYIDKFF